MDKEKYGLSLSEVEQLKAQGKVNVPVDPPSKTIKQIIAGNVFTYFNLVFAVLAALLILVGSFRDLTFVPVILCNMFIGIIQEIRSKKVLDKISMLNAPKASVIREGIEQVINADELVEGDLVLFRAGSQICADAVVVYGHAMVNESLLTGEADEISKDKDSKLMSGSFVVSGECAARLTKVGADSYISKLTLEAKAIKGKNQPEMIRSLDTLVKTIGIIIIPIGILMFLINHIAIHATVKESVVAVVAALVGMIPEGLYLLASVALVVSVMRLARSNVLIHEMGCIETLARVNVLCVDKTGTITENEMSVSGVEPLAKNYTDEEFFADMSDFVKNMSKDNITMAALGKFFDKPSGRSATDVTGFSSKVKYSSVTFGKDAYVLGAPEFVLREKFDTYKDRIEQYAKQGNRVLVFARYLGNIDGNALSAPVEELGLVMLSNPIRKEARDTFAYFAEQGVEIKVISGDNPVTVSNVAGKAGIAGAENYIDARTLKNEQDIFDAVAKYTVFGRVTPDQKRMFVRALKEQKKTVAMTGDGVNDVLALKDADCSVAMASGSEAAANAAQIVLLDSNFSRMPSVVLEGRRVVNNIQRSASLFLIKNIFSILMAFFTIILGVVYPLKPTQLSLLGAFTIGAPAFVLALQPNKSLIKCHFLTNVFLKALPAGLTDFIMIVALIIFNRRLGLPPEILSTLAISVMLVVGMATLIGICYPFNLLRILLCIAMAVGIVISYLFFGNIFALERLQPNHYLLLLVFGAIAVGALVALSRLVKMLTGYIMKKSRRFRRAVGEE